MAQSAITSGPYDTEWQAADDCRGTYIGSYGRPGGLTRKNHEQLLAACAAAGVELGAYDDRILEWISGYEPETVQVLIGIITRANRRAR